MIQQSHFWVYIQRKQNHHLEEIAILPCSLQHYSKQPMYGKMEKPKCPSTDEWIKKVLHTHTHTHTHTPVYYSALKQKEILSPTTWMNLEGIMLSEINQTKTNMARVLLLVELKKKKESLIETEQKSDCQGLVVGEIGRNW